MFSKPVAVLALLCAFAGPVAAQACYESSIQSPVPFMGNNGEVFKLADGSLWEVKYEYEYMYEYYPDVVVCPSKGIVIIAGKRLNVEQLASSKTPSRPRSQLAPTSEFIEAQIDGDFSGWEGETIFKLDNGQIWQQASYAYTYSYSYRPKVTIFPAGGGYEMQVEGVSSRIRVRRLR